MPGHGDNNKHRAAGRGANNQSNQPFVTPDVNEPASNHDKKQTGEQSDVKRKAKTFNLLVDNVPYLVKAVPFSFNDEVRFYISINGGQDHVFTWDSQLRVIRSIDKDAASLPAALEDEISQKLQADINE